MMPKLLMIGGPTAVGKTDLSIRLAKDLNGEVVNGDAYQVYRGMDIGTAKATPEEQAGISHHLLDIVAPGTPFTVAQFQRLAEAAIEDITSRHKLPIIVGGTGFYMNALRLGLPLGGQAPPSAYREQLQLALAAHDAGWLWRQLDQVDPVAAAAIPEGNSRRVIRALEVIHETGNLFSQQPDSTPQYDALVIGLTTERAALYARINQRVELMINAGLIEEVRRVVALAGPDSQALKAIGYKELLPYLNQEASLADCVATIQQHSRQYAKRQLTYWRHQLPTRWFDLIAHPEQYQDILAQARTWAQSEE